MDYFALGFHHIISPAGFDHQLFIVVLCALWSWQDWRRILVLLTGFTAGHSLTLALTSLGVVAFPSKVVEPLIMATILITSLSNVIFPRPKSIGWPFGMAMVFGLVHGCGFAGYFSMMLGEEESILLPLLGFNLGLEAGQILTVTGFYGLFFLIEKVRPVPQRDWTIFVSGAGAGLAFKMLLGLIQ